MNFFLTPTFYNKVGFQGYSLHVLVNVMMAWSIRLLYYLFEFDIRYSSPSIALCLSLSHFSKEDHLPNVCTSYQSNRLQKIPSQMWFFPYVKHCPTRIACNYFIGPLILILFILIIKVCLYYNYYGIRPLIRYFKWSFAAA